MCTTTEFNNSKLVIDCDPRNNLLFTSIKQQNVALSIYNTILSKYLLAIVVAIVFIDAVLRVLYLGSMSFLCSY